MAKNLKQIMKNLGMDLTQNLFLKLSLDEINKYKSDSFNPEFNEEKIRNFIKKKKIVNYKKIIYHYEKNLSSLSSFKIATNFLKTVIRKKHKAYNEKLVVDFESVVRKLILDFLTYYLKNLHLKKSNSFDISYNKFINFLDKELFHVFCFTTLRNFDSNISSIFLPNDQIFRLRTSEEFSTICDIKDAKIMPRINPNFQKIKFILGTHIPKTRISEQKIKDRLERFLFGLKIFHSGDVQFGGIYYRDSAEWDVKPTICIKPEPILGKPKEKYQLESKSLTNKDFKKFMNDFSKINFTKGKHVFLGRSIKRFSQAIENENQLDKIVDFVICLESLYSTNEQQLSFRFAMRTAIVLGQTSFQKTTIQDFILQIYDMRSKIVHGDDVPDIIIDDKKIEMYVILNKLEQISRNSIKIFLQLINNFDSKEDLHKNIDESIYDLLKQKKFKRIFNKSKLPIIHISQK